MKIFKIYFNPEQGDQSIVILNEEMNFKAALFTWLWAAYKQMWSISVITLIAQIIASSIAEYYPYLAIALISGINLIYLFFAENLYAMHLEHNGYKLRDIVLASCLDEAELKYYSRNERQLT